MTNDLGFKVLKSPVLNELDYNEFVEWANTNSIKFSSVIFGEKHAINFAITTQTDLMTFAILKWNLEVISLKKSQFDFFN